MVAIFVGQLMLHLRSHRPQEAQQLMVKASSDRRFHFVDHVIDNSPNAIESRGQNTSGHSLMLLHRVSPASRLLGLRTPVLFPSLARLLQIGQGHSPSLTLDAVGRNTRHARATTDSAGGKVTLQGAGNKLKVTIDAAAVPFNGQVLKLITKEGNGHLDLYLSKLTVELEEISLDRLRESEALVTIKPLAPRVLEIAQPQGQKQILDILPDRSQHFSVHLGAPYHNQELQAICHSYSFVLG
ncbi:hypothetical protein PsorP6_001568 [Peronosclerospora sorghi]|uniref:Uncharacterized protein n=1 Tax=Peronosclerospora sorghi TaxID=230839 RepID=A0ACC0WSP5_9STRA|nr:hypothetical protein PsorP6_001568 [Peronosclerospora sorghi]